MAVHAKEKALEMSDFPQGQRKLFTYNSGNPNKTQQEGLGGTTAAFHRSTHRRRVFLSSFEWGEKTEYRPTYCIA